MLDLSAVDVSQCVPKIHVGQTRCTFCTFFGLSWRSQFVHSSFKNNYKCWKSNRQIRSVLNAFTSYVAAANGWCFSWKLLIVSWQKLDFSWTDWPLRTMIWKGCQSYFALHCRLMAYLCAGVFSSLHLCSKTLVVKTMMEDSPGELGVNKAVECDTFSLQCSDSVGWVTGRASCL